MSAEDLYKHTLASWDDEVEYAETLRNRRNIFSTGLVVIAGLGAFQLSPFMGESDQYVIPCIWMRWTITGFVLLALILVVIGAKLLYSSGQESVQEQNIQKEAQKANPGTPRIRRAAELLRMLPDEEAALASTGTMDEAAWMLRAKKLQLCLIF